MCGIAGIVAKNATAYRENLIRMTDAIRHRGPDGDGFHFFDDCGLGHRRLAIIDLSTGDQPMMSRDGKIGLVFNGEIYGYRALKESLEYQYATTSDTEVILAGYEKYGHDIASYLPGMFAFALYDQRKKRLVCARDRFGEKPFYYAFGRSGEFLFASEIKAILASDLMRPKLNNAAIAYYLRHLYVHPCTTAYENIHVLPPAHSLVYENGKVSIKRYWELKPVNYRITLDEATEEFVRLFRSSVEKQLIADVPLGVFLSGGLDSTAVVAMASERKKNLRTFSFGFGETINELPFAREVAERYGTEHTELQPKEHDLAELLIKMQDVYDEPFGDSSNIPTYLLAEAASKHVKVALGGDGGDELLGGYGVYKPYFYFKKDIEHSNAKYKLLHFLARALRRFSPLQTRRMSEMFMGRAYSYKFDSIFAAHAEANAVFGADEVRSLGLSTEAHLNESVLTTTGTVDDAMRNDLENYMPGDILVKTDRAAMAHGLEMRAPFLDVEFANFCISLPVSFKATKDSDKQILRKALHDFYPDSVLKRRKQGFGSPVREWLGSSVLMKLKNKVLGDSQSKIFSLLNYKSVEPLVKRDDYKTWTLLVLALWMEKHYE